MLQLRICELEQCHVTTGHAEPIFGSAFLIVIRNLFQNHILLEATRQTRTFWNSNLHEWRRISDVNGV